MGTVRVQGLSEPAAEDGALRILVDGGREAAHGAGAQWIPELAPSQGLYDWFAGRPERWQEFRRRYQYELSGNPHVHRLAQEAQRREVVLMTSLPNAAESPAEVLRGMLRGR